MYLNGTYSKVRVGQNFSDTFRFKNGLNQGEVLSPFIFDFSSEHAIMRVQVNEDGLKLNGTHQFLVYANDVNISGGSVRTMKKNTEALVVACKEISLEVYADKTKYVVMRRDQNAGKTTI